MELFGKYYGLNYPMRKRISRFVEFSIRMTIFLCYPVVPAVLCTAGWYFGFYKNGIHFPKEMEGINTAGFIPFVSLAYMLLVAVKIGCVWSELKAIRASIKEYNFKAFRLLCDEDLGPVAHSIMGVFSWAVLLAFCLHDYGDNPFSAGVMIWAVSYLLGLVFFTIQQMDNPLKGLWYIKSVHKEWLSVDIKAYRKNLYLELRKEFESTCVQAPRT
jgi:hypothetical protein